MSDLSGIQQRLQATRTKIEQNNNAIGQNQGNISTNEADILQNKNDIAGNASAVDANNSAIESTKSSIASVESELSSVSGKKSGVQESIQGLKAKLDNPDIDDATRNQIEGDIKSQEMSFADFEKMEADLTRQKTELENKKAEQEQQGAQLKAEGEQFAQKGVDLSQTQTQLKDESATLEQTRADLASEEQQIQAEYEAAKNEPEVITEEVNGKKITKEIDPETGRVLKATEEENGKTVTSEFGEDGKVKAKTATSANGNTAVYDGKGNTVITVKAGESAGQIYNKFYAGDNNAENKENLINLFRNQVRTKDGEKLAADYNPSEKELQTFFNQKAGFTPDGTKMKDGGILQAGQELKIPTEIDPDNVNLQGRDASVEKAKGNAAEKERQAFAKEKAEADARRQEAAKVDEKISDLKQNLIKTLKSNASVYNQENERLNAADGSHVSGNMIYNAHNELLQKAINSLGEDASYDDIAKAISTATGNGALQVKVTGSEIREYLVAKDELRNNPDDAELKAKVNELSSKYSMKDFIETISYNRSGDNKFGKLVLDIEMNAVTSGTTAGAAKFGSKFGVKVAEKVAEKTLTKGQKVLDVAKKVVDQFDAQTFMGDFQSFASGIASDQSSEGFLKATVSAIDSHFGGSGLISTAFSNLIDSMTESEKTELASKLDGKSPLEQKKILEEKVGK